jgi:uncharacterized protein
MSLLIDGYNLLYVSGILGGGTGPGGLERSRLALLNFLAASIEPRQLQRTTVVFDSHNALWGLPKQMNHQGITVCFAQQYEEADDLIEELIRADSTPRRLVVVSSDHRLQRAARRRRAKAIDSDVWYAELIRARRERETIASTTPARPAVPLLTEDVEYWLRQFGGEAALAEFLRRESGGPPVAPEAKRDKPVEPPAPESDKPPPEKLDEIDNPFPPGYGEDLLRDDEL